MSIRADQLVDRCAECGRLIPPFAKRGKFWLRQCRANGDRGYCRAQERDPIKRLASLAATSEHPCVLSSGELA